MKSKKLTKAFLYQDITPVRLPIAQTKQHHLQLSISPKSQKRVRILSVRRWDFWNVLPQSAKKNVAAYVYLRGAWKKWRFENTFLRWEAPSRCRLVPQGSILARSTPQDLWARICPSIKSPRPEREKIRSYRWRSLIHRGREGACKR